MADAYYLTNLMLLVGSDFLVFVIVSCAILLSPFYTLPLKVIIDLLLFIVVFSGTRSLIIGLLSMILSFISIGPYHSLTYAFFCLKFIQKEIDVLVLLGYILRCNFLSD